MTDGKHVPPNPISGAKLLKGNRQRICTYSRAYQNNEKYFQRGSPVRLRPYAIQITKLSFHKGKRVSTTRRKELTGHRKRDAIAEENVIKFSNWDNEKGMWGQKQICKSGCMKAKFPTGRGVIQ